MMSIMVQFIEEEANGRRLAEDVLELSRETMTAFDLVRERVYQHVHDEAPRQAAFRRSVFEPEMTEAKLNAQRSSTGGVHDWKRQLRYAITAFESGRVLLFIDGQQVHSLEESVTLSPTTKVIFLKLVPLVGG